MDGEGGGRREMGYKDLHACQKEEEEEKRNSPGAKEGSGGRQVDGGEILLRRRLRLKGWKLELPVLPSLYEDGELGGREQNGLFGEDSPVATVWRGRNNNYRQEGRILTFLSISSGSGGRKEDGRERDEGYKRGGEDRDGAKTSFFLAVRRARREREREIHFLSPPSTTSSSSFSPV